MKKKLLVLAMMTVVASTMFLTGCGDEGEKKESASTNSSASTEAGSDSEAEVDENGVIQVPATIVNNTGVDIQALAMSGAGQETYGENIIEGQELTDGSNLQVTLNIDKDNVKWDFLCTDSEGSALTFRDLDLSECSTEGVTITFAYDEDSESFVASAE